MEEKIQAVILAAGKSTRTYPLTINRPKPMLRVLDKTLLEHNLDQLVLTDKVREAIIVTGFEKEQIMKKIGSNYKSLKIRYVTQKEINGTGGALLQCREHLKGKFVVMNGDDLYSYNDINVCMKHELCVMAQKVENPSIWGIFTLKDKKVISFIEKPENADSDLGNIGLYTFNPQIFKFELKKTERGEFEITDYVSYLIKSGTDVACEIVSDYWISAGYPWNYLEANVFMLRRLANENKSVIKGEVEENVKINGFVFLDHGSVIKSNTCIEGPVYIGKNSEIGPFAHIRPDTIIGNKCRIGKDEMYDCVIMDNTTSKHTGYIAHSVICENVNIGAGTITADYRHDGKNNITFVQGKKVDSQRRKLGAFIGDDVMTGIGTLIYPGRKIWPGMTTLPGEIVKKDIIKEE